MLSITFSNKTYFQGIKAKGHQLFPWKHRESSGALMLRLKICFQKPRETFWRIEYFDWAVKVCIWKSHNSSYSIVLAVRTSVCFNSTG